MKHFKKLMRYSMTMGATGLIAGASPTPMKEPIQVVATRGSEYVVPMAAVTGASMAIKQLSNLKPKKRKRRYK
jgi:hypothetical protein